MKITTRLLAGSAFLLSLSCAVHAANITGTVQDTASQTAPHFLVDIYQLGLFWDTKLETVVTNASGVADRKFDLADGTRRA